MFDFDKELEPECFRNTFRTKDYEYFKKEKDIILNFLKNHNKDYISVNGNYVDYFVKRYLIGIELWNKLSHFNNNIISNLKSDKYKDTVNKLINMIKSDFDIRKYQFLIDPVSYFCNSIMSYTVTAESDFNKNEFLINDISNRKDRDMHFDKNYFSIEMEFVESLLNNYHSKIIHHLNISSCNIRFIINASNYCDKENRLHQVLTLSIINDGDSLDPVVSIMFYYIPDSTETFTTTESSNNINNYSQKSVNLLYMMHNNFKCHCDCKNLHIYRCNKPIFDSDIQKILRMFYWIHQRSKIENKCMYTNYESKTKTHLFNEFRRGFDYNSDINNDEILDSFNSEYPMYDPNYFSKYKKSIVDSDIETQWYYQLFFKTINKCLNNIENDHHNNSYVQDISYRFDNYISSLNALIPLYLKNRTISSRKLNIIDKLNEENYVMLSEKILSDNFDEF